MFWSLYGVGGGGGGAGDGKGGGHWSGAGRAVCSLFMLDVSFFFFCLDFVVGRFCGELNAAVNCCIVWWNYTIRTRVSAYIYISTPRPFIYGYINRGRENGNSGTR